MVDLVGVLPLDSELYRLLLPLCCFLPGPSTKCSPDGSILSMSNELFQISVSSENQYDFRCLTYLNCVSAIWISLTQAALSHRVLQEEYRLSLVLPYLYCKRDTKAFFNIRTVFHDINQEKVNALKILP